jgi:hypothetical protein
MIPDPRTDPIAFIETALTEVCFGDEASHPLEATIDRYFSPHYAQRTDGVLCDRDGFAAHIRALRALVAAGSVEVCEAIGNGDRIADRHQVIVTKRDGSTSRLEVYLFGEVAADGRLLRVEEITRILDGDDADTSIAQVR